MKRWITAGLCLLLLPMLCACEKQAAAALQIGDTAFGAGVYAYVLGEVIKDADETAGREALLAQTNERCAVFAALDARMKAEGVTLSAPLKSETADRVRGLWQYFSAYYTARGIEKPDLTRVLTWEAELKALTTARFGEGGKDAVPEKKLQQWFTESYVGYRGFFEPLTKQNAAGETVALTDAQKGELRARFDEMQKRAAAGESIDSLYKEYSKSKGLLVTADADVTVVKAGDPTVTKAFFAAVAALKTGETAVAENGSRLWLLQKIDLLEADTPYFAEARDDVLFAKKQSVIEQELREQADVSAAEADARLCGEIFERVRAANAAP